MPQLNPRHVLGLAVILQISILGITLSAKAAEKLSVRHAHATRVKKIVRADSSPKRKLEMAVRDWASTNRGLVKAAHLDFLAKNPPKQERLSFADQIFAQMTGPYVQGVDPKTLRVVDVALVSVDKFKGGKPSFLVELKLNKQTQGPGASQGMRTNLKWRLETPRRAFETIVENYLKK